MFGGAIGSYRYFDTKIDLDSTELAGYGDVTYKITSRLKAFGGLRVFKTTARYYEADRKVLNFNTLGYDRQTFENNAKDNGVTWRAGLSYEPVPTAQVYASVSTGYRVGQANANQGPSIVDPTDVVVRQGYAADRTTNYEIGAKADLADGRLSINAAAFYIVWKNIQQDFTRVSDGRSYTDNTGTAVSKGVELQVTARPVNGLDVGGSVTLQNAEITDINPADSQRTGVKKGDRLPGSIKTKLAGHLQYTHALSDEASLYGRVDGQYTGSSPNYFPQLAISGNPNPFLATNSDYTNVDLQIGYTRSNWNIAAYVENLTDNDAFILNDGGVSPNPVTTLRPRTWGLRLGLRY